MAMDLSLLARYDVRGPRYTSYPTALQFEEKDETAYQERAGATDPNGPLSLYMHLPFCSTLCYYCACSKVVTRDKSKAVEYLQRLHLEIRRQAELFPDREVVQLHWGGGTPTFLTDAQMQALMSETRSNFKVADDDHAELGIEIDPRTVDPGRIQLLRNIGFNRISMGIQDFNPAVQQAVNRKQPFAETKTVVDAVRDVDFRSLSVDLIYGLPHQTLPTFEETLAQVISLSPDRISIYNYAHLPDRFAPQRRINLVDLPDAEQKLLILKLCIERLGEAGYSYIGMDHFAKPDDDLAIAQREGSLHRNFQGYSTHAECDLIGMGMTAIGQVAGSFFQNEKDLGEYQARIDSGVLAVTKGYVVSRDDLIRRAIIMSLICQFRADFADLDRQFDINSKRYFEAELASLAGMVDDGLLTIEDGCISVLENGRLLIRNICMAFDSHLSPATERYSKAI